jgi:microcompartment protein CcmK/EutM
MDAPSYLLIDTCDQHGRQKQDFLVALDLMGASRGEVVLLSQGSAARQTIVTDDRPIDAVIIGIVDQVDESGVLTYQKALG